MSEVLEHHEHAERAAEAGRSRTALLIAVLAAALAFSEQGAQHAETHASESSIAAADLWAQYQAKSIRAAMAADLADLAEVVAGDASARQALAARLRADRSHYESDPGNGKAALAHKAEALERERDRALERLHAFENASGVFQLAIVLATSSVITGSALLVRGAGLLGAAGAVLGLLGLLAPHLAAF